MSDNSELISQFSELTQAPTTSALNGFFNGSTQRSSPTPESSRSQTPTSSSASRSTTNNKPQQSKMKTFQDLVNSDGKDDDDEQNFFAGGGRGSGLEVENPSDPTNLVQDLLKKAETGQGHPDRMNEDDEEVVSKPKFTGTGYSLGSTDVPSRVIGSRSSGPKKLEKATREITFWKDGFQVGDGKLYKYDDPANATYLAELNSGRAPLALLDVEYGQNVDVNVIKKLDEEYKPPKRKIGGFHGSGQRLGSPVSTDYQPPAPQAQAPTTTESKQEPSQPKDEGSGDTQVQIRLADGRRVVRRVESNGPVKQLYDYVTSETSSTKSFVLSHAFPVKPIEDKEQNMLIKIPIRQFQIRSLQIPKRLISDGFFNRHIINPLFGGPGGSGATRLHPNAGIPSQIKIEPIVKVPSIFDYYEKFRPSTGFNPDYFPIDSRFISSERLGYSGSLLQRPDVGSLVEVQKDNGSIHLGIVISKQLGLFHEDLDKLSMIDVNGEQVDFIASDISFHLFKVIDKSTIEQPLSIRTIDQVVQTLNYFINTSLIIRHNNMELYQAAQAWFIKDQSSVKVDLEEITKFIKKYTTKKSNINDLLQLECMLFATHLELSRDPVNWFTFKNKANHHLDNRISKSIAQFNYYSNSIETSEYLELATRLNDETLTRIGESFKNQINENDLDLKDYDDLKPYIKSVIQLMKHYIIYPHPLLKERLVPIMTAVLSSSSDFTTQKVYDILEELDEYNEDTHIFQTLDSKSINHQNSIPNIEISRSTYDYFQYMREPFQKTAYGIPSISNLNISDLAISLDKSIDSWFLQIHVLDVGSQISLNSKLVEEFIKNQVSISDDPENPLIPENILEMLIFHNNSPGNNAITFNIEFPLKSFNGWEDSKLISIGLTSLDAFKFVPIEEINDLIDTKVDLLSLIFKSNEKQSKHKVLDSNDKSSLSSIFKLIEQWQIIRNNKHSLEFSFPYKKCIKQKDGSLKLLDSIPLNLDFLKFIRNELNFMISEHLNNYENHDIPLIKHSQDILPPLNDSIEVESNKFSIPNYQSLKYEHFTLFPNVRGEISLKKFICGSQFLNHEVITTSSNQGSSYYKHGLSSGFINIMNGLNNYEDLVNQWQIIMYLKKQLQLNEGYNFHLNQHLLNFKLMNSNELLKFYKYEIEPIQIQD
ncbi:NSFL1 cofactor p47 [Wickerhamomyces ciferrii]|uniref:NSFL1 cofactor p47 n=1 Tax=Wickerhamomyces ciferrii (strain ATCC 14091 / BCRC 22168 / CBS 111 / JCM 3599 / NBRC 0793 / NRRL Y-1031 F-60-10) TaxID=1206466 RepID=K0KT15_WICCF|nr:NSFL1 cofactor p47 [Wickerhamomyces ciferrii]CCH45187.1 NSFL1 cofactor p47 [Wickerhamomyces ciferrii]